MQDLVNLVGGWVWSYWLVGLCLGAGLLFSGLTRFLQVRHFRHMIELLFSSKESERGISSFQALAVSLSGRVGTGNIAGVAAAIAVPPLWAGLPFQSVTMPPAACTTASGPWLS